MKPHSFHQGPPLRALCVGCHGFPDAVPLRGGFFNAVGDSSPAPILARTGAWAAFDESFAATELSLGEKCAPPVITFFPRGVHCVRPIGARSTVVFQTTPAIAAVANRHLQNLRAKAAAGEGRHPYVDFDHHDTGIAAEVDEFFWDGFRIRAAVRWTPEAEAKILAGEYGGLSPHWISSSGDFLGLRANVGALLHKDAQPAFKALPKILPCTKRQAMRARAARFVNLMDARSLELKASGRENSLLAAHDEVAGEFPELHAAFKLRTALEDEHWQDLKLAAQ